MESSHARKVAAVPRGVGVGKVTLKAGAASTVDALVGVCLADHDAGRPLGLRQVHQLSWFDK